MSCRCDQTRGQSCGACDGTADVRISQAEDDRDYGRDPEHDTQRAERAYDTYMGW